MSELLEDDLYTRRYNKQNGLPKNIVFLCGVKIRKLHKLTLNIYIKEQNKRKLSKV